MSANDRQVGGNHYSAPKGLEQHWDRVDRLGLDYFQGQITKYVERWKLKDGIKDLKKAAHFLQKYIELREPAQEPLADMTMVQADTLLTMDLAGGITFKPVTPNSIQSNVGSHPTVVERAPEQRWTFISALCVFNGMFGLPIPKKPGWYEGTRSLARERLEQFKIILQKELNEVDDILIAEKAGATELEVLTALADWLGDMQVYCASEMLRWGIPLNATLKDIMDSQESKLGEDGKPIVSGGKVVKGPNYVAPEPRIRLTLIRAGMHPGTLGEHENAEWQCEGFYGDGTQLYRHRKSRKMVRRATLAQAYEWLAEGSQTPVEAPKQAGQGVGHTTGPGALPGAVD